MKTELIIMLVVSAALFGLPLWTKWFALLRGKPDEQPPAEDPESPPSPARTDSAADGGRTPEKNPR